MQGILTSLALSSVDHSGGQLPPPPLVMEQIHLATRPALIDTLQAARKSSRKVFLFFLASIDPATGESWCPGEHTFAMSRKIVLRLPAVDLELYPRSPMRSSPYNSHNVLSPSMVYTSIPIPTFSCILQTAAERNPWFPASSPPSLLPPPPLLLCSPTSGSGRGRSGGTPPTASAPLPSPSPACRRSCGGSGRSRAAGTRETLAGQRMDGWEMIQQMTRRR